MKKWILRIFGRLLFRVLHFLPGLYGVRSYSQEGEDMILRRLLERQTKGFYVDVGAHHPHRYSNTYYFYRRGWSGVNIDAMPGSMRAFREARPRDRNVEAAIADRERELTFYMFDDPALNSLDESLARARADEGYQIVAERKVITRALQDILRDYMPAGQAIDFMSVDVEGFDLKVLQSNDWQIFRPKYLLVESAGASIEEVVQSSIYRFLKANGYALSAKTANTAIYQDLESL